MSHESDLSDEEGDTYTTLISKPRQQQTLAGTMQTMETLELTLFRGFGGYAFQMMLSIVLTNTVNSYVEMDACEHGPLFKMKQWLAACNSRGIREAQQLFVKGFNILGNMLMRLYFMKLPQVDSVPEDQVINNKYFTWANTRVRKP
eukprot:gb/GECH01014676.1/.p1 GENE.gb/GECH01014676.1/~~gb/GECH01014676.1/.p1  ORF type:complete len:146 (+),score=16.36 gb/GECH01014676.1/:1-438(+)